MFRHTDELTGELLQLNARSKYRNTARTVDIVFSLKKKSQILTRHGSGEKDIDDFADTSGRSR